MTISDVQQPFLSIVCITYNHEKYIGQAIDGFLMQDFDLPYEIIIGDDCSKDQTSLIVAAYASKYPDRIKPIIRTVNVGAMRNFLDCLSRANGKYVAICEGDDYWTDSQKIRTQCSVLESDQSVDMVFHMADQVCEDGRNLPPIASGLEELVPARLIFKNGGGFIPTASIMLRSSVVEKLPQWLERMPVGDYFIQCIAAARGGARFINKSMCAYRRGSSSSITRSMNNIENRIKYQKSMLEGLLALNLVTSTRFKREITHRGYRISVHSMKSFIRWGSFAGAIMVIRTIAIFNFLIICKFYG